MSLTSSSLVLVKLPKKAADHIKFADEGIEYSIMMPEEYLARDDAWPALQEHAIDYT